MRRFTLVLAAACAAALAGTAPAQASTETLKRPSALSAAEREAVHDAGAAGVRFAAERLNTDCPGVATKGVSASGCIVDPAGCTANFIFTDGTYKYVGTARHCVDSVGQPQTMAFVLRKSSPWKAQLDQFLDGFTHSSEYFQLIRRYFGQDAEQMVRLSRGG